MIESLKIKNFRLFKELEIDGFKRVNLIVGKNNSGKSCLLEAIYLLLTKGNFSYIIDLLKDRDELRVDFDSKKERDYFDDTDKNEHPIRFLFNGYRIPPRLDENIVQISSQSSKLSIGHVAYKLGIDGNLKKINVLEKDDKFENNLSHGIMIKYGNNSLYEFPLKMNKTKMQHYIDSATEIEEINFLPGPSKFDLYISQLWDFISMTELEDEIVNSLRIIEPNLGKINLLGAERVPVIKYKDSSEKVPLKSLGDGMTRLFHIILALVNSKDGCLIIDEIENGLHWKTQPKVWEIIFQLSEKLNVQVFASTHSSDIVRTYCEAWGDNIESGAFHRLESSAEKGSRSVRYSHEKLSISDEMNVEVR